MMALEWSLGSLASSSRSCWSGETGWCYYHSDMRNWFVGSLWAIGSGLIVYLAARRDLADSVNSFVAGLLAVGVALFPTNAPDNVPTIIARLHVAFAALLFALLGVICFRF